MRCGRGTEFFSLPAFTRFTCLCETLGASHSRYPINFEKEGGH